MLVHPKGCLKKGGPDGVTVTIIHWQTKKIIDQKMCPVSKSWMKWDVPGNSASLWPFWDGEFSWPLQRLSEFKWPPTFGDQKGTLNNLVLNFLRFHHPIITACIAWLTRIWTTAMLAVEIGQFSKGFLPHKTLNTEKKTKGGAHVAFLSFCSVWAVIKTPVVWVI